MDSGASLYRCAGAANVLRMNKVLNMKAVTIRAAFKKDLLSVNSRAVVST